MRIIYVTQTSKKAQKNTQMHKKGLNLDEIVLLPDRERISNMPCDVRLMEWIALVVKLP